MPLRQVTLTDSPPGQPELHSEHPLLRSMRVRGYYLAERHDPTWTNTGAFPVNWARGHGLATDGSTTTNAPRLYRAESIATGTKIVVLLAFVPQNTSETSRYIWHANNSTTSTALTNRTWGIGQNGATVAFYARDAIRVSSGSVLVPGVPVVAAGSYDVGASLEACHVDGGATLGSYANSFNMQAYINVGGGDAGGSTARVLWAIWGDMDGTSTSRSDWCQRATGHFRHNLRDVYRPQRIWVPVSAGGGANGSVTLTGAGTTASAGTLAATGAAAVTLAGANATAAAGSVTASASSDATAVVTGAGTTASAGTLAATGAAAVTLTGAATTAAAGTLSASASGDAAATVTGASTTAAAGTLAATGAAAVTLTGAAATASAGTVSASAGTNAAVTLTGASASATVGALAATGAAQITVTGVQVSASAGTLSAVGQQHGAVTLTGAAAIAACGTLTAFTGAVVREYVRADSAIARTVAGASAIVPASAGSSAVARSVTLTSRIDAEGTA